MEPIIKMASWFDLVLAFWYTPGLFVHAQSAKVGNVDPYFSRAFREAPLLLIGCCHNFQDCQKIRSRLASHRRF